MKLNDILKEEFDLPGTGRAKLNSIDRGGRKSSSKDLFGAKWDKQREIK